MSTARPPASDRSSAPAACTAWQAALARKGLVGHAGAILLRKAAGQAGLTGQLSAALRKKGTPPLLDRGDRAGLDGGPPVTVAGQAA